MKDRIEAMKAIDAYKEALREIQRIAIKELCVTEVEPGNVLAADMACQKALGGIYNYCEVVLRAGRPK